MPLATIGFDGVLPREIGGLMVAGLVAYLVVSYREAKRASAREEVALKQEVQEVVEVSSLQGNTVANFGLALGGLGMLIVGAHFFVVSALVVARNLGMSELMIGLTVVAVGTSLPELVTSAVAARRQCTDLALGNIIGSNIFNGLGILGIATIVRPQILPRETLVWDLPVLIVGTLVLVPIVFTGNRISRREGLLLLAGYVAYAAGMIIRSPA